MRRIPSGAKNPISPTEAAATWRYDLETGKLFWRIRPCNPIHIGDLAGNVSDEGYIRVEYKRQRYMAHWIVWAILKGCWPTGLLDHRDNDGTNNREANLRESDAPKNMANRRRGQGHNLRGAQYRSKDDAWVGMCGGEYLGTFLTEEAAHEAYKKAAVTRYGEFARFD